MKPGNSSTPLELEVKLIIIHNNPAQIASEISKLGQIGEYQLVLPRSMDIHDIYFDTPEETLRKKRLAFRLRIENNQHFLAVKGKKRVEKWGGVERLEIEIPWSINAFQQIRVQLEQYGIDLPLKTELMLDNNPLESLQGIGLSIIQDRGTFRLTRQIQSGNDIVAELAIDKVNYKRNDRILIHYEIEIEAKKPQGVTAIQVIQEHLQSEYGNILQLSVFSKLLLGMVLRELPENPEYFELQKTVSHLFPASYGWIEKRMKAFHE